MIKKSFTYEGVRYYIRAESDVDFEVKKALKIRDLQEGKVTVSGDMLLKDWAKRCVDTYKTGQKEVTRKAFMSRLQRGILDHIGNVPLKKIKPINCQETLNLQAGKSKSHINEVYNAMRFLFKKAKENHLIVADPTENLIKPQGTKGNRRSITEYEREHIIKVACGTRKYYVFLLMLYCGCRPSEAREAMGKDIINIEGYNMLHIRGTKTENADRFVPIPDDFYELIKNIPKNEHIAVMQTGNPLKYENRSKLWHSFTRELNLSMGCKTYRNQLIPPFPLAPDLVPYCLRHTYCTDLARNGIDIRMAQKLMGHADIQMTANIYTNFIQDDLVSAAQILQKCHASATVKRDKTV